MNEAAQNVVTGKRTWLGVRLVIYALLAGIAASFYFGMNSIEEWDASSGQSRYVTTVVGVPVWFGAPRPTTVSEWLGEPMEKEVWIRVRGPRIRKAKVSHCVHDLLSQFFHLEGDLANVHGRKDAREGRLLRRQIAAGVLHELRSTQDICGVSRHFSEFRMQLVDAFWHDQEPLTSAKLEETWNRSSGFMNEQLNKPSEPARTQ